MALTVNRSVKKRSSSRNETMAGRRMLSSWFQMKCAKTFGAALAQGARPYAMNGSQSWVSTGQFIPKRKIFSDYARGAIRLSAIMEIPTIHIFTHDSIGVGEDGPTHQPVEQLASLRAIPNLIVLRPGDANEVAEAWRVIMQLKHEPACLILSRQPIPTLDRANYASAENTKYGG